MSAKGTAAADAVVAIINAETFSTPFVASRKFWSSVDVENLDELVVEVIPRTHGLTRANRVLMHSAIEVHVGFRIQISGADDPLIDSTIALVEEVGRFMLDKKLATAHGSMTLKRAELPDGVTHDEEMASEHNVVQSLLVLNYHLTS